MKLKKKKNLEKKQAHRENDAEWIWKRPRKREGSGNWWMTDQTQAKAGPGMGISVDHGRGHVGHHARRAKPLTSAEEACLDTGKEHRVLENDGIHGPSFMLRIIIGKLWHFKEASLQSHTDCHCFPQTQLFLPLHESLSLLFPDFLMNKLWFLVY